LYFFYTHRFGTCNYGLLAKNHECHTRHTCILAALVQHPTHLSHLLDTYTDLLLSYRHLYLVAFSIGIPALLVLDSLVLAFLTLWYHWYSASVSLSRRTHIHDSTCLFYCRLRITTLPLSSSVSSLFLHTTQPLYIDTHNHSLHNKALFSYTVLYF
jgi:hypothetical protein